jgi:hypothetical protein
MTAALSIASNVYGRQMQVGRDEPIIDADIPINDAHMHLFDRPPLGEGLSPQRSGILIPSHQIIAIRQRTSSRSAGN